MLDAAGFLAALPRDCDLPAGALREGEVREFDAPADAVGDLLAPSAAPTATSRISPRSTTRGISDSSTPASARPARPSTCCVPTRCSPDCGRSSRGWRPTSPPPRGRR
ncbi:hypothetical protein [Halosegnis marinus]|uniref:hypothetical protein n=1 Tax=Halosegnis marinus TaxID=3034023 RepID=UPI00361C9D08